VSISGSILALYGAVLSTITAAAQIIGHFRDRAQIKIRVEPNMEVIGDPSLWGKTFTIVKLETGIHSPWPAVERVGARSDRGACAQRAFDRREPTER